MTQLTKYYIYNWHTHSLGSEYVLSSCQTHFMLGETQFSESEPEQASSGSVCSWHHVNVENTERERWMPITIIGLEICEKATNNPQLGAKPGHNRGKLHDSLPRPQLRSCCSAPLTMSSLQLIPRLLQPATIELYCPWPIETRDLKPIIQILEPFINKVHNRLGMCSLYQTLHSTRSSTSNHGKMDTSCGKRMFVFV